MISLEIDNNNLHLTDATFLNKPQCFYAKVKTYLAIKIHREIRSNYKAYRRQFKTNLLRSVIRDRLRTAVTSDSIKTTPSDVKLIFMRACAGAKNTCENFHE